MNSEQLEKLVYQVADELDLDVRSIEYTDIGVSVRYAAHGLNAETLLTYDNIEQSDEASILAQLYAYMSGIG